MSTYVGFSFLVLRRKVLPDGNSYFLQWWCVCVMWTLTKCNGAITTPQFLIRKLKWDQYQQGSILESSTPLFLQQSTHIFTLNEIKAEMASCLVHKLSHLSALTQHLRKNFQHSKHFDYRIVDKGLGMGRPHPLRAHHALAPMPQRCCEIITNFISQMIKTEAWNV